MSSTSGSNIIRGLAHVCYTVSNLEQSLAFYCDKLGLTPAFDFVDDAGRKYGQYIHVGGRGFIEIFEGELGERAAGQPYRHLCLEVVDFDQAMVELQARGVEVGNVKQGKDHSMQAWIVDPDGNRIELHGYTLDSKQSAWLEPV
ncbi:MAG: VOC family protein [Anaerolineae bacterium]|nr:VOC family protein [Anaerolineae bacterium]